MPSASLLPSAAHHHHTKDQAMTTTTTRPQAIATGCPAVGVYVACLASYNAGRLHGAWVDLEECQDVDDLQEAINWVLRHSPEPGAEEWAVHDSCGLPGYLSRTEWPELTQLIEWAQAAAELSDADELEAYRIECDNQGETITIDAFRDVYRGVYASGEDYAQELAEELGNIPANAGWPAYCIDWEAAWRELTFDGYREERCNSGGVHVFCV